MVKVVYMNEVKMPLSWRDFAIDILYTQMKKGHNLFRPSREQTDKLFMNNEYCILLSKPLLILFHKPKDLIYRAGYSLPWRN